MAPRTQAGSAQGFPGDLHAVHDAGEHRGLDGLLFVNLQLQGCAQRLERRIRPLMRDLALEMRKAEKAWHEQLE
ncbi:hypothetical protein [Azotobacter salinestris]|uniref:hypothetical protein n=1 Tax=Azotobacter salinestris TaxID=69964 RepID=UPI001266DC10|nr:hypothetical protein [Azotobacter salinestris]